MLYERWSAVAMSRAIACCISVCQLWRCPELLHISVCQLWRCLDETSVCQLGVESCYGRVAFELSYSACCRSIVKSCFSCQSAEAIIYSSRSHGQRFYVYHCSNPSSAAVMSWATPSNILVSADWVILCQIT